MPGSRRPRAGFTLIEVMVAVAIAGLVIAGGFKLVTVSLRALSEVRLEQELVNEAQKVYLDYMAKEDMPDRGEKDVVHAINGIVFRNAMDISNSLNSLMASDQFVVEVIRNGVPTSLQYEVR